MRDRRVVKDGVAYKSGIRDVHAIKLFEPDNETRKSHMFALAFTSCPSVCDQCFSSFNRFWDNVVQRIIEIPKEHFVSVKKRNFQKNQKDKDQEANPRKKLKWLKFETNCKNMKFSDSFWSSTLENRLKW